MPPLLLLARPGKRWNNSSFPAFYAAARARLPQRRAVAADTPRSGRHAAFDAG